MRLKQTPSQTVGPFFAYGLTPGPYGYPFAGAVDARTCDARTPGRRIQVVGQVLDGDGEPIPDALVEIWQADGQGHYAEPGRNDGFRGFARSGTGADARQVFLFETVKPGAIAPGHAPHIGVTLFMRGLLSHLYTRLYFDDEAEANGRDPALLLVPEERRRTLIARKVAAPGEPIYRFDIRMQGPDETVFFDV